MRISDWSSDVCSSDLRGASQRQQQRTRNHRRRSERPRHGGILDWPRRYATPNPKRKAAMDPHRWRLDGQLALVTGGSAGIGLAIARELLGFGARVLIAVRNGHSLERARRSDERRGGKAG